MTRILIVDDEPLAREQLKRLLEAEEEFQVAGEASNGEEALQRLKNESFDVVFFDIDMPVMNGLDAATRLTTWEDPPLVVFATAYHQYAIEAFETHAIDYILKPYEPARLTKTFEQIRRHLEARGAMKSKLRLLEEDLAEKGKIRKLMGHKRNARDRMVIDPSEVLYFQARYAEVTAHLEGQELIVNSTLKDLLAHLDPEKFAQTHKAYVVNIDCIRKLTPMFSGNFEIVLKSSGDPRIPLSRRYAKTLKDLLSG